MSLLNRLYFTMSFVLFLAFFLLQTFYLQNQTFGFFLMIIFVYLVGKSLGSFLAKKEEVLIQIAHGIFFFLSFVVCLGSLFYYFYTLPKTLFISIVLLTPTLIWFVQQKTHETSFFQRMHLYLSSKKHLLSTVFLFSVSVVFILLGMNFHEILSNPITKPTRSPFEFFSSSYFLYFGLASCYVATFLYRGREKKLSLFLFLILLGSLLTFSAFLYPVGFGFDPFIHQSTEKHLFQFETIQPKPFYYIGQYVLVLFFSHSFSIPIQIVDTFLVPILSTLLLTFFWFYGSSHVSKNGKMSLITLFGIFFLSLSPFTLTTPQNLSFLFVILTVLSSIPMMLNKEPFAPKRLLLYSTATMLIHPFSGIPLFIFIFLIFSNKYHNHLVRKILLVSISTIGSLMLPIAFLGYEWFTKKTTTFHFPTFSWSNVYEKLNLQVFFEHRFSPIIDFVYLLGKNSFLLILLFSFLGWWYYKKEIKKTFIPYFLTVVILCSNYFLLSFVTDFSFLIDYERSNYTNRIIPLITYFLIPFFLLFLNHLSVNLRTRPLSLKILIIFICTTLASSSFYLSFPRKDVYESNHGFNAGKSDIEAVYTIEKMANKKPYVVLANQTVSAVAMRELGFRYFGDQFFYPIPTSSKMYEQFLNMSTFPSLETIKQTQNIFSNIDRIDKIYFVINSYWWKSEELIEQSKALTSNWKSVGNGEVFVFEFEVEKVVE